MWPFSKNKDSQADSDQNSGAFDTDQAPHSDETATSSQVDEQAHESSSGSQNDFALDYDPMTGDCGPFDSRREDVADYDLTDFAKGQVDLGSMLIPIPHSGDVQVEVGPDGPQAVHIATPFGRLTPVAFAAPKSGGLWESTISEISSQFDPAEATVTVENGPWGKEILAVGDGGVVRVIGVNGSGWMFRLSLQGPKGQVDELTQMGRALAARVIVKRGDQPMPAGDILPVVLPQELVQQLNEMIEKRQQEAEAEERARQEANAAAARDNGSGITMEITKEPEAPEQSQNTHRQDEVDLSDYPDDAPASPEVASAAFSHHMPPRRDEPAIDEISDADLGSQKGTSH